MQYAGPRPCNTRAPSHPAAYAYSVPALSTALRAQSSASLRATTTLSPCVATAYGAGTSTPISRPPCDSMMPFDPFRAGRSEEHTSELQSREKLVCRPLLEKKKQLKQSNHGGPLNG